MGTKAGDSVTVVIIDDDEAVREALEGLLDSVGLRSRSFASVQQYVDLSPAIDAGVGTCTASDQRKLPRPQDGNGDGVAGCDLGAYERAAP